LLEVASRWRETLKCDAVFSDFQASDIIISGKGHAKFEIVSLCVAVMTQRFVSFKGAHLLTKKVLFDEFLGFNPLLGACPERNRDNS